MSFEHATIAEVLDDLAARFLINVPDAELASLERIHFQIEQAHWYYEDFVREQNTRLPSHSLRTFASLFFRHCPLLAPWREGHEEAYEAFLQYKYRVPVCGAILLNSTLDRVLLVKGWSARAGWGFPRGKINQEELDVDCAVREVMEETGFDLGPWIRPEAYIERSVREQRVKLFVVEGIPEDTPFIPQTRKEISKIEWHRIQDLPVHSRDREKGVYNRFYMVVPFVA
ncbi:DCP2-domain-containing protein [Piptocephalis cylindrospora]|uniref:DCP2-domain-containing protein n=1 Tax=Piptocephalis cylindrospora TaxID=1907219 RepID=A0A4P9Y750_9FUNG|nr:DCP2-domain-containing protein [Piptocephalis cylindrospora]|eukprot:RKP14875.1 DCP2-domain-containing protein [Piptocephalis cylindrospora]